MAAKKMEAFRLIKRLMKRDRNLAKADQTLAKAEGIAGLAIADACSMSNGVCYKSISTLAAEFSSSVRQIEYGLHGRQREDGSFYFTGLLQKRIVFVTAGGRPEDGVPTTYGIDLKLLRTLANGAKTSAQTTAQTSAQNNGEPLHNEASNLCTDPCTNADKVLGSSKSSSTTPTPNGGGAGGEKSPDQSQQPPQKNICESDALTEQSMIDALQGAYDRKLNDLVRVTTPIGTYSVDLERLGVPGALNTAGSRELFATLVDKFGVTHAELDVVAEAFGDWFDTTYLLGFKNKYEAEARNDDAAENNRPLEHVPQPIQCPLVIFRKNMKIHIDANRKYRREEAEEQASI